MDEMIISGRPPLEGYKFESNLSIPYHDAIVATYPDGVTEVYTFKRHGINGQTVAVVTVVYTDSTKALISTVTRA